MSGSGFVFAVNRNRDGYQIPIALHEAGLLDTLVTDFYAGNPLARRLPAPFGQRFAPQLNGVRARNAWASFAVQYGGLALRIGAERFFPISDRLLAATAARVARRRDAPLYAYSSYIPERSSVTPGRPLISFEYHPHPAFSLDLLEQDFALYPQVRQSIEDERIDAARQVATTSWREASHIVCASSTTLRSLLYVGCPAERCTVIPYGVEALPRAVPRPRQNERCQMLFVGQGIQRKGLHHLLTAWADARLDQAELTLVCYRIDPGIAAMVEELVAQGHSVRLLSRQSRDQLSALYQRADVFVMPSIIEGFGLVYLEALGEGCHVLATHNTGLADLALAPESATLVTPGAIEELTESLRLVWQRWDKGELDPAAIAADAARRSWADFRREIADHARRALAYPAGEGLITSNS